MSCVTVIDGGKTVIVGPDDLTADDILEFGAALIEEHGHKKGDSGDASQGWSIHGAVGEAARRATGESGKDGPRSRVLREVAAQQLFAKHGKGEFEVNDAAPTPAEAVHAMLDARKGV